MWLQRAGFPVSPLGLRGSHPLVFADDNSSQDPGGKKIINFHTDAAKHEILDLVQSPECHK